MSFDLGQWANQLSCDMCNGDPPLDLDSELNGDLPGDFWDEPPAPPEGFDFGLPDFYPTFEFSEDGFMFGVHGSF